MSSLDEKMAFCPFHILIPFLSLQAGMMPIDQEVSTTGSDTLGHVKNKEKVKNKKHTC